MRPIYLPVLAVVLLLSVCACESTEMMGAEARAWVAIDPVQCDNNAWNPSGMSADDYYRSLGVDVTRMVSIRVYEAVCLACTCPTGDRLFLEIDAGSLDFMIGQGFTPNPGPKGT